jgi:hypothetical protein
MDVSDVCCCAVAAAAGMRKNAPAAAAAPKAKAVPKPAETSGGDLDPRSVALPGALSESCASATARDSFVGCITPGSTAGQKSTALFEARCFFPVELVSIG